MSQWKILHNPRCSKSRQALALLQEEGIEPEVVEYLKTPLSKTELETVAKALKLKPKDMLRTKEEEFKKLHLDTEKDNAVFKAMADHPKIMERPIVIKGKRAVIGRPPERVKELF